MLVYKHLQSVCRHSSKKCYNVSIPTKALIMYIEISGNLVDAKEAMHKAGCYMQHLDTNRFWTDNKEIFKGAKTALRKAKFKFVATTS